MKRAIIFPGQGAQAVGMGKDSYDTSAEIKNIYEIADKLFTESNSGEKSISEISFNGPEDQLTRTLYTQPAILTLSLALASEAKKAISEGKMEAPLYTAGHSLGEFAALYMADVLSLEDTLKLVIKRAALMENAPAGAMTAIIGLNNEQVDELIKNEAEVSVANYNAPDQIVITGSKTAVEKTNEEISKYAEANSLRAKVIPLSVGGAFHSPLMQAASDEFAKEIDACEFKNPSIAIIQNINAEAQKDAEAIKTNLKQQMTGSVQWTKTVKLLISENEEIWEIGPGKVLAGLVKKQERRFSVKNIASIADLNSLLGQDLAESTQG